ncbi:MAG: hypothetical protein R3190_14745 [Thermoanaerobaculia bacterium]|nr:hypothetical protein [Thermoanaerobaculia bacterium]
MAEYDDKSRYRDLATYEVVDRRGRTVPVLPVPPTPTESLIGYHARRQGQRLDHLAHHYLANPGGFWRIAELNDVMLPEALSEAAEIAIPSKRRGG